MFRLTCTIHVGSKAGDDLERTSTYVRSLGFGKDCREDLFVQKKLEYNQCSAVKCTIRLYMLQQQYIPFRDVILACDSSATRHMYVYDDVFDCNGGIHADIHTSYRLHFIFLFRLPSDKQIQMHECPLNKYQLIIIVFAMMNVQQNILDSNLTNKQGLFFFCLSLHTLVFTYTDLPSLSLLCSAAIYTFVSGAGRQSFRSYTHTYQC